MGWWFGPFKQHHQQQEMLAYFTSLAHVVSLFLLIFLSVVPPSHPGDQAFPSVLKLPCAELVVVQT